MIKIRVIKWILSILVIVIVIVIIAVNIGSILFDKKVKGEVEKLFADSNKDDNKIITEEDIKKLPLPVQKWLKRSKIIGKQKVHSVRLKQKGFFKTKQDQDWMPFRAEQYYTTDEPQFLWYTTMKPSYLLMIKGRDIFYEGHGNMLIKLFSLIKVADAKGKEIDQGTLVRYLNEIMWFPSAALNDYISWEAIDQKSARATIEYKGVEASAVFYFNEDGDIINFIAKRYMDLGEGRYKKEDWATPLDEYKEFNGVRLPVKGKGIWKLESGDFTYIILEIVDIEYNNNKMY